MKCRTIKRNIDTSNMSGHTKSKIIDYLKNLEIVRDKYIEMEINKPKQLTIKQLREQFDELPNVKPYLNSNEIMTSMMDGMFCFYLDCARANNLIKE